MNYIITVNTYNRPVKLVLRCLESCLRQEIKPLRVILIDQNIIPLVFPNEITSNNLIEIEKINKKSISEARNSITIPAETEWIFFCDDDGFPDDNYSIVLKEIINKNPKLDLLGGVYLREDNKEYYNSRQRMKGGIKSFIDTKKIMGSNLVVKAKTFNELGRFSPDFGVGAFWGAGEETDLVWKAYFTHKNIEFFHELIIYHPPIMSLSLWGEMQKSYNYGVGKAGLVAKWLFKKSKLVVLYEFLEMLALPTINIIVGIITFNFKKTLTSLAALFGRIIGVARGLLYRFS